jgi:hypothetical protein
MDERNRHLLHVQQTFELKSLVKIGVSQTGTGTGTSRVTEVACQGYHKSVFSAFPMTDYLCVAFILNCPEHVCPYGRHKVGNCSFTRRHLLYDYN